MVSYHPLPHLIHSHEGLLGGLSILDLKEEDGLEQSPRPYTLMNAIPVKMARKQAVSMWT